MLLFGYSDKYYYFCIVKTLLCGNTMSQTNAAFFANKRYTPTVTAWGSGNTPKASHNRA